MLCSSTDCSDIRPRFRPCSALGHSLHIFEGCSMCPLHMPQILIIFCALGTLFLHISEGCSMHASGTFLRVLNACSPCTFLLSTITNLHALCTFLRVLNALSFSKGAQRTLLVPRMISARFLFQGCSAHNDTKFMILAHF